MGLRRVIIVAIGLALLLAALIGLLVFNQLGALARARAMVERTHLVREQNQALYTLVREAEAAERGYLLTADSAYLPAYERAVVAIPKAEARLAQLVQDNPGQLERVSTLNGAISERLAVLARAVDLARNGDLAASREVVRAGGGLAKMARVRDLAEVISQGEKLLLDQRSARAAAQQQLGFAIGLAVGGLALVALVAAVAILARANAGLSKAMAEARQAQSAREASDALQRAIFTNIPDMLFVLQVEDGDRFVVGDVNPAFEKALRVQASRIRGRALNELVRGSIGERLLEHYRRVRAADAPVISRDVIPGLPDGPRTWESVLAPVRNARGVTDRIIGASRDITDRVRAEEQLHASQRMEAIGQLTGGVAHDFNNLLQVIRGNLELIAPALTSNATAKRRLANAIYGADRAGQLTRQLLAFARRQPLAPQPLNLSRLVGDMADLLRRTLGEAIEVETVVAGGLWNTLADPAQVESAILNLALNARDAMPQGGRLTIEITNAVLDAAYARANQDLAAGQYVLLAVSDTGVGMDAATRARVFEPFFTTKAEGKGTGLGLAMVYGFVRQSNGHAQIYSEPGHGTTVKIYLPRSRQPEAAPVEAATLPPATPGGQSILVVEDEPDVRAAAVAMLEALGYRCLEAGDAEAALAALEEAERVDLVFSDVVMPGPLKVREFIGKLREIDPALPILFTSGYTENAIVHQGRLDDGVALLSKPYAQDDLAHRVAQLIRRPETPE